MSSIVTVLDVGDSSLTALNSMNTNIAMMTASSYIGKYVELTPPSENGDEKVENITGKVLSVVRNNGAINIKLEQANGEVKEYSYSTVIKVQDTPIKN